MKKLKKTLLSITLVLMLTTAFGLDTFAGEAEDPIGLGCVSPAIHILHINNI